MFLLLACHKPEPEPIDSTPTVEDTGCEVGTAVGECPEDYDLYDQEGDVHTLSEHERAVVSVSVMWDPTWQDRVRDIDEFCEAHPEVPTFDVLCENLAGEDPIGDDALLWSDSLGLSLTVLLSDEEFRESWPSPGEYGSYVVFVEDGAVRFRGISSTVALKETLESYVD